MSETHAHPEHVPFEVPGQAYEHDMETFSKLDRGFGTSVFFGYLGGVVVVFAFIFIAMSVAAPDIPMTARVGAAVGVAFWIGILGGVVAVGLWAQKHETELFHG